MVCTLLGPFQQRSGIHFPTLVRLNLVWRILREACPDGKALLVNVICADFNTCHDYFNYTLSIKPCAF